MKSIKENSQERDIVLSTYCFSLLFLGLMLWRHVLNFHTVLTHACFALTDGLIVLPIYLLRAFSMIQMLEIVKLNLVEVLENCPPSP